MKKIAQVISYLGHPLLMPTYIYALIFLNHPMYIKDQDVYLILIALIFFVTCFLPAWVAFFLLKSGVIKSMTLDELSDRKIPFFITSILYVVGSYLMSRATFLNKEFVFFMYVIAFNVTVTGFISSRWKISAHAVGAGGLLGVLTYVNFTFYFEFFQLVYLFAIPLVGTLLWARLYLHAHTPKQVYVGFIGSFSSSLILLYFIL
jgi:membrane-associated phospholipid phosphatase